MGDTFRCLECGRVYDNVDICPECGCPASYTQNETLLDDPADYADEELDLDEEDELDEEDDLDDEEDEVVEEDDEDTIEEDFVDGLTDEPYDPIDHYEEMLLEEKFGNKSKTF